MVQLAATVEEHDFYNARHLIEVLVSGLVRTSIRLDARYHELFVSNVTKVMRNAEWK